MNAIASPLSSAVLSPPPAAAPETAANGPAAQAFAQALQQARQDHRTADARKQAQGHDAQTQDVRRLEARRIDTQRREARLRDSADQERQAQASALAAGQPGATEGEHRMTGRAGPDSEASGIEPTGAPSETAAKASRPGAGRTDATGSPGEGSPAARVAGERLQAPTAPVGAAGGGNGNGDLGRSDAAAPDAADASHRTGSAPVAGGSERAGARPGPRNGARSAGGGAAPASGANGRPEFGAARPLHDTRTAAMLATSGGNASGATGPADAAGAMLGSLSSVATPAFNTGLRGVPFDRMDTARVTGGGSPDAEAGPTGSPVVLTAFAGGGHPGDLGGGASGHGRWNGSGAGSEAWLRSGADAITGRPEGSAGAPDGRGGFDALIASASPDPGPAGELGVAQAWAAATGIAAPGSGVGLPDAPGSAPAERPVAAHVLSEAFAPALGAELRVLIQDGVSEARLHLNPAEMGPISVRIQIEGQSAQVEMAARDAGTRQVLEQAMPTLAGALQDSGLTLTGGGVFEQSRQPAGDPAAGSSPAPWPSAGRGAPGGASPAAEPTPRAIRLPQGVVDVYA